MAEGIRRQNQTAKPDDKTRQRKSNAKNQKVNKQAAKNTINEEHNHNHE
jgi:hypothetical protein